MAEWAHLVAAFKEGLSEAGYLDGRNSSPRRRLVGMLVTSTAAQTRSELGDVQAAAGKLGQQVRIFT
jgi:hypothetical protein